MKECIVDVKLVNRPITSKCQRQDCPDGSRLDNRAESLIKVNTRALSKSAEDPTSLIASERAIRMKLMTKYPFTRDEVDAGRSGNEVPSAISLESLKFLGHGGPPVGICKGATVRLGNR